MLEINDNNSMFFYPDYPLSVSKSAHQHLKTPQIRLFHAQPKPDTYAN